MTALDRLAPGHAWTDAIARWTRSQLWDWYPISTGRAIVLGAANALLVRPLAWLYLHGPRSVGFWGGATAPEICAQLTGTQEQFWTRSQENAEECSGLIQRHFWSWLVLGTTATYFMIVLVTLCACWERVWKRRRANQVMVVNAENIVAN